MTDRSASSASSEASFSDSVSSTASSSANTDNSWTNSSWRSTDSQSSWDSVDSLWGSSIDNVTGSWGGETMEALNFEAHSSLWGGSDPSNWYTSNDWGSMRSGWSTDTSGDMQAGNAVAAHLDDGHTFSPENANQSDAQGHAVRAEESSAPEALPSNDEHTSSSENANHSDTQGYTVVAGESSIVEALPSEETSAVTEQHASLSTADQVENRANLQEAFTSDQELQKASDGVKEAAAKFAESEPKTLGDSLSGAGDVAHKTAAVANAYGAGLGERLEGTLGVHGNIAEAFGGVFGEFTEGIAEVGGKAGAMGLNVAGDVLSSAGKALQNLEGGLDALRHGDLGGIGQIAEGAYDIMKADLNVTTHFIGGLFSIAGEIVEAEGEMAYEIGEAIVDTVEDYFGTAQSGHAQSSSATASTSGMSNPHGGDWSGDGGKEAPISSYATTSEAASTPANATETSQTSQTDSASNYSGEMSTNDSTSAVGSDVSSFNSSSTSVTDSSSLSASSTSVTDSSSSISSSSSSGI